MKKRIIFSFFMVFIMVTSMLFLGISSSAATGVESGYVQDTSNPDNGKVYWSYAYDTNRGTATLTLSGNGYMPNGMAEQTWIPLSYNVGCYLTKVVIEEGVKGIVEGAFYGEAYLTKVSLPESLVVIGDSAFSYTGITEMHIPSKVNYLCPSMFSGSPITRFTVSDDNTNYADNNGFVYSKDMTSLVLVPGGRWMNNPDYNYSIPSCVTQIGDEAFSSINISSITIPSNVKKIRAMAFYNTPLESVVIENGVEMLYDSVFINCPYLEEVHLPSSITYIGRMAFGYNYEVDFVGASQFVSDNGVAHPALDYNNIEYYLYLADGSIDMFLYPEVYPSFTIYAPEDSVSNQYAENNGLNYIKSQALMPVLRKATSTINGVTVSWSVSGDADGYYVFKRIDGAWTLIADIPNPNVTSYEDVDATPLQTNRYTVRAYNSTGKSVYDKTGISCVYIEAPSGIGVKNTYKGVSVTWDSADGYDEYYVYRKNSSVGSWKYVGKVDGSKRKFIDTSAEGGKRYYYTVKSKLNNKYSAYDSSGESTVFIAAPKLTKTYNTANSIALKWTYSGNADSFMIYRKTGSGSWKLIKTVDGSKRVFYDGSTKRGTKYTYTVKATYNEYISGYYPDGITAVSIESPLSVKVKNRRTGVQVEWNKCGGAKGYYVYRKTTGGWKKIATVTGNSKVSYIDKTAKSGVKYRYTVKAYNGSYYSTYNSSGFAIEFLSAPKLRSATSTKNGVKISYTEVTGSEGYYIYRKTSDSSWKKIGTVKKSATTSFTDKKAVKGTTYTYTVKAFDGSYVSGYYAGIKVKDKY